MSCHLLCDTHRHHQVEGGGGGEKGRGEGERYRSARNFCKHKIPGVCPGN